MLCPVRPMSHNTSLASEVHESFTKRLALLVSRTRKVYLLLQHEVRSALKLCTWHQIPSWNKLRKYFGKDNVSLAKTSPMFFQISCQVLQINSTKLLNMVCIITEKQLPLPKEFKTWLDHVLLPCQSSLVWGRLVMNLKLPPSPQERASGCWGLPNLKSKLPFTRWKHVKLLLQEKAAPKSSQK